MDSSPLAHANIPAHPINRYSLHGSPRKPSYRKNPNVCSREIFDHWFAIDRSTAHALGIGRNLSWYVQLQLKYAYPTFRQHTIGRGNINERSIEIIVRSTGHLNSTHSTTRARRVRTFLRQTNKQNDTQKCQCFVTFVHQPDQNQSVLLWLMCCMRNGSSMREWEDLCVFAERMLIRRTCQSQTMLWWI